VSDSADPRRDLPSVDRLLSMEEAAEVVVRWGRPAVTEALRTVVDEFRVQLRAGTRETSQIREADILDAADDYLTRRDSPGLRPVLNGTGVVLHTNLGRAPLPQSALARLVAVGRGYCNLELDVESGKRGDRYEHCAAWIRRLTGSEDALVVNNTAAAIALAVNRFADRRQVIVARGELVEIGGSFRLPEVIRASGGVLVEVGSTNRTRAKDYQAAIGPETALILKVHPSNYRIEGFTEQTELADLVRVGREASIPVAHDLGSGMLLPGLTPLLPAEPTPGESASAGADLVMWSGDKLLGGPQAGIVHGRQEWISQLRQSPLLRAFRVDKLTLAALEATLALYANPGNAATEIPALARLVEPAGSVRARAERLLQFLEPSTRDRVRIVDLVSLVGGGTYPGVGIPSAGWRIEGPYAPVEEACRSSRPPLIGRIEDDAFIVDFRTLSPGDDDEAAAALISRVLGSGEARFDV
jgi:L-seryl-tRNA(Ser) seleniumtransferase